LLLGILCGLVNGFVIAKLKINALITTLATMQIVRGLAYIISDGKAVGIEDESFFALGYANWFGLPAPIWLTVACLIIFGLLLNKTTFGRNTLAIGGNEEAARLAGGRCISGKTRPTFEELAVMFEGSTASGAERAYRKAVDKLTELLVAEGAIHAVRLKQKSKIKRKKKISAPAHPNTQHSTRPRMG